MNRTFGIKREFTYGINRIYQIMPIDGNFGLHAVIHSFDENDYLTKQTNTLTIINDEFFKAVSAYGDEIYFWVSWEHNKRNIHLFTPDGKYITTLERFKTGIGISGYEVDADKIVSIRKDKVKQAELKAKSDYDKSIEFYKKWCTVFPKTEEQRKARMKVLEQKLNNRLKEIANWKIEPVVIVKPEDIVIEHPVTRIEI